EQPPPMFELQIGFHHQHDIRVLVRRRHRTIERKRDKSVERQPTKVAQEDFLVRHSESISGRVRAPLTKARRVSNRSAATSSAAPPGSSFAPPQTTRTS